MGSVPPISARCAAGLAKAPALPDRHVRFSEYLPKYKEDSTNKDESANEETMPQLTVMNFRPIVELYDGMWFRFLIKPTTADDFAYGDFISPSHASCNEMKEVRACLRMFWLYHKRETYPIGSLIHLFVNAVYLHECPYKSDQSGLIYLRTETFAAIFDVAKKIVKAVQRVLVFAPKSDALPTPPAIALGSVDSATGAHPKILAAHTNTYIDVDDASKYSHVVELPTYAQIKQICQDYVDLACVAELIEINKPVVINDRPITSTPTRSLKSSLKPTGSR